MLRPPGLSHACATSCPSHCSCFILSAFPSPHQLPRVPCLPLVGQPGSKAGKNRKHPLPSRRRPAVGWPVGLSMGGGLRADVVVSSRVGRGRRVRSRGGCAVQLGFGSVWP